MPPSSPALRAVLATASSAVLAVSITLPAGSAAMADSPEPTPTATATTSPGCWDDCSQEPASPAPSPARPTRTRPAERPGTPAPSSPAPQPVQPTSSAASTTDPAAPPAPAEPGSGPATGTDRPGTDAAAADPGTSAGPTQAPTRRDGGAPVSGHPSSDSNWNTPITRSAKATQAAAVSRAEMSARGGPDLPTVAAGALLVGAGGGVFAWWVRNRPRAH